MSENIIVDIGDEDGIIITDGNNDRCYVYFSEIPELIKKLDSMCNRGVPL